MGLAHDAPYLQLMHGVGLLMAVLFAYLYFGLYRRPGAAVKDDDTATAAGVTTKMRPVMAINLSLGLLNCAIGFVGSAL
ncbi:MAG: hypothetical protein H6960_11375 [Chromatiaceae bacterium]|nr:hypothetical protein [Chromatiaceae bacterium]